MKLNDLLTASDSGSISILTLLDLSAAFDTIDHSILLTHLENTFGIHDLALSFFRSYLQDRLRSGELRMQKLKSHLVRTQSLNVLPL